MKNSAKSVLVIYNPGAKRGKIEEIIPNIKKRLSLRYSSVDFMAGQTANGAEELAAQYADKYDIIVSCGGDGTLHQVVNGVAKSGHNPLIGILPFGTCNDVSRTLNIPKKLDKAIDCILRLNTTKYDVMFDGTNYISYSLAAGYFTPVSFATSSTLKRRFGRFAYFLYAFKILFKSKFMPMTITFGEEKYNGKVAFILIMNGTSVAGFKLNKGEDLANNSVKLVVVKGANPFATFFRFLKLFMFGIKAVKKSKQVIVADISECEIKNPSNEAFAVDGEREEFLKKTITVTNQITFITK